MTDPAKLDADLDGILGEGGGTTLDDVLDRLAERIDTTRTGALVICHVRRLHEREAERRAESWAANNGYLKVGEYQHVPLAGFDLLFIDSAGDELQVEGKSYLNRQLAAVHLQPSQARRATDAAAGQPPAWRLYALRGAGTKHPDEHVLAPDRVVELLANGGLQVKGGGGRSKPSPTLTTPPAAVAALTAQS